MHDRPGPFLSDGLYNCNMAPSAESSIQVVHFSALFYPNILFPNMIFFTGMFQMLAGMGQAFTITGRAGVPEEIGAMAAYLASPEAEFITGARFVIDGGIVIKNPPEVVSSNTSADK